MRYCLETDFLKRKQKVLQTQSRYWQEGGKKREYVIKIIVLGTKLETSGKTQQVSDVHSQGLSLTSSTV